MGSKNRCILLFSLLILLATSVVIAQEDFSASSQKSVLIACEGSTITDVITVKNTGIATSTYALSLDGSGSKWASVAPTAFTLNPGEYVNVYNYLTPPLGSKGDYDLSLHVTTGPGSLKIMSQKLSIRSCLNINLATTVTSQTICQCNTATYKVALKNTGGYSETYSLSLSQFSKYAQFSENPVSLSSGESKEVYILITPPCNVFGEKEAILNVYGEKSRFVSSVKLNLYVVSCYDFDISALNSYSFCENKATIPVTIINKDVENSYKISLVAPNWASLSTKAFDLRTREAKAVNLNLNFPEKTKGAFDLILNVESLKGDVEKSKSIRVNRQICYLPEIDIKNNLVVNYSTTFFQVKIKNNGLKTSTYLLSAEGLSWASLEPSALKLNPGDSSIVKLKLAPVKTLKKGSYPLEIKAKVLESNEVYSKKATVQLKEFKKIPPIYYLSALAFLLLIILIFVLIRFLPKGEEAVKEQKPIVKKIEKKPEKAVKEQKPKAKPEEKPKPKHKKSAFEKLMKKITLKHYLILALLLLLILFGFLSFLKPGYISGIADSVKSIKLTASPSSLVPPPKFQPTTPPLNIGDIKNFLVEYMYYIIAGIALLIIFIFLVFKKKPEFKEGKKVKAEAKEVVKKIEKKPEKKLKPAKEKKPAETPKIKAGKWIWYLIAILILAGIAYLIYRYYPQISRAAYSTFSSLSKGVSQIFVKSHTLTTLINLISLYKYYILAGIIILIIIVIFLLRSIKTQVKEAEEGAETGYWSYISWFLGLAISIALLYFFVKLLLIPYWKYILLGIAALIVLFILIALLRKMKTKRTEETVFEETSPTKESSLVIIGKRFGIGEIILKTKKKMNNVKLSVTKLRGKPTFMRASEKVYEYYEINKENIRNTDISKAVARFRVKKSWLDKNRVNEHNISLKRYSGRWNSLPTKIIDSDDSYFYYESELDKLSYFAIAMTKAEKEEKEEKEEARKWPWIVLLLLLVLAGTYFYYAMTQPAPPATQQEPVLKQNFTTQIWNEDTSLTIDLSKYFYDPDNDKLIVTSTKPENMEVDISGTTVVLTPESNWYGTSYIMFTVDDGKGGVISSGKITLIVKYVPEPAFFEKLKELFLNSYNSAKDTVANYLNYFIYGIIALVILLLLVKYNKPILDFFLEEEDEKNNKKGSRK